MRACVFLGGEPGVGKTTIVRNLLPSFGPCAQFQCGSVRGHLYPDTKVLVLGLYMEQEVFSGTDRLSTALLHDIPALCEKLHHTYFEDYALLAEGSRIFTVSCIDIFARYFSQKITLVELSSSLAQIRREARGKQNESWAKGIHTQVANVVAHYEHSLPICHFLNDTIVHARRNIDSISSLLKIV